MKNTRGGILALLIGAALVIACGGPSGDTDPTGTMNDPVQNKKVGRRCVTPGQFGETKKGTLLICDTRRDRHKHGDEVIDKGDEKTPHWHVY